MSDIIEPPFDTHDDEDPFLIPPGQPGAMVDRLAVAQGWLKSIEPRDAAVQLELLVKVVLRGGRT
jgi:hypothetical protein